MKAEGKEKKFSLQTRIGCLRLLAIFLCGVLLFSFFAALISSDFGQVKISHLKVDSRGAELDMDLYVPAGVSDSDSLPCLILAHGRGATKNVMRGFAEEFSRRGYVVVNVNAYGMGLSEQPVRDEAGNSAESFTFGNGSFGLVDTLNYVRTLAYVDQERIAMLGHSFGSSRSSSAAIADCGYYTLNDRLINILYDVFGQSFTADEITQDANQLAAERLNADQMAYYEQLAADTEQTYNTRINTLILTGATSGPAPSTVTVAGYEVQRECQVNVTYIAGMYDSLGAGATWNDDGTTTILGEPLKQSEFWYQISTDGSTYTEIGDFAATTVSDNETLADALATRTARLVCYAPESHSKQYFSSHSIEDAILILEQAFSYNNGELTDSATQAIAAGSTIWFLRAVCNLISMLCMIASLFPLVGLLLTTTFFKPCVVAPHKAEAGGGRAVYWILAAVTVVFTIISLYQANSGGPTWASGAIRILPNVLRLVPTSAIADWFVVWLAGGSAILLVAKAVISKKNTGSWGLKQLNLSAGISVILKTILIGIIAITFANAQLVAIGRLFNQDFRFWQMMFSDMKIEHWLVVGTPYVILFFVMYLIIGASINYGADSVLSGKKEMVATVVINSCGVWILCLFCYIMWFVNWTGAAISDFTLSYSMLLFVPVTVYITRKMYKITNTIWLGAFINACLLSWSLVSSAGIADNYYGQGFISILFGV